MSATASEPRRKAKKASAMNNIPAGAIDANGVVDNTKAARLRPLPVRLAAHFKHFWPIWVMIAPALCFVALFAYVPMYGLRLAFVDYDPVEGIMGGEWVGLKYFKQFFESPQFLQLMGNTFRISLWTLVMGFIAPIILALLINQIGNMKIKSFVQTITYMPHFISVVVIVSMINIFLNPGSGIIGRFTGDKSLLANADLFTPIYWITEVWQHMGWDCIIYLAALSSVDLALYEAAKIDGAGRLQLIKYVDIPTILPTVGIMLILRMGSVLSVGFEKVFLMQNPMNLPKSNVISVYTYQIGILGNQFSYGTAIGLFNTVINFVFLVVANYISKKASDTSIF